MSELIDGYFETFRGGVNTWECDENAHMNVQFYVARASDASFFLRHALGLTPSRIRAEKRTTITLEEHLRFHRELHAGDIMRMRTRIIAMRDKTMTVCHELLNANTDETAATIVSTCGHLDLEKRRLIAWDDGARKRGEALTGPLPEHARPRGLDAQTRLPAITLAQAGARGFIDIHRGPAMPWQCGDSGHMNTQFYMSRFSDGGGHLWRSLGMDRSSMLRQGRGTIALEQRISYVREVRSGDTLIIKSALSGMTDKTLRFTHLMFNAETGELAASSDSIAAILDLERRKIVALAGESRASLERHLRVAESPA